MSALVVAALAAYGVHLVWTSAALGWDGLGAGPRRPRSRERARDGATRWLREAGLDDIGPAQLASTVVALGLLGTLLALAVFGAPAPALMAGLAAATIPPSTLRGRRRRRREKAQEAWPRIIEEVRVLTGSVGRSVPQALFEAGRRAPAELRGAFESAEREWLLTTDFERTTELLRAHLADPTADAACETLLVAHQVGGSDLDRRLEALAEDRIADIAGRKDARAQQSGVRFARRFVLIVPLGMALAGMSVGNGRAAYRQPTGQLAVLVAMAMIAGCWIWAGKLLRLPDEERVFQS